MPKLHVKTYGCQMNAHDGERVVEMMAAEGWDATDDPGEADLVVLNTCHIREKAAEKVYSDLGRLRPLRDANPALTVAVTGCVAQAEGAEIAARAPIVDLVIGPQALHRLPAHLARARAGEPVVDTGFAPRAKFDRFRPRAPRGPSAFLTVQEGCDKFCAFCVVPYTRGAEVSRPLARVVEDARALAAHGAREVTLLGQNVNAWHGDAAGGGAGNGADLAALVRALAAIEGIERIRYTTSHPNDMGGALIAAHGTEPKLMPFLHLPVQSGSDRVLRAMNRKHTAADYLRLVGRLRDARPDLALSSDFIVGFPGETEAEFRDTLALVEAVGFAQAFAFAYSPRPGTPAAERPGVDPAEARDRLHRLQALLASQAAAALHARVGQVVEVLFEKPGRMAGQVTGRSPHNEPIHVEGPGSLRGALRAVHVTAVTSHSLAGRLVA